MGMRDSGAAADRQDLCEIAQGLPQPMVDLLVELTSLVPEAQEMVLGTIGPGSRLVLEALGLVHVGDGGLTSEGALVCELLAERDVEDERSETGSVVDASARFVPIASVSAHADLARTAASTGIDTEFGDPGGAPNAEYDVYMDRPGEARRGASDATVYVIREDGFLRLWQLDTGGPAIVVEQSSGTPLPIGGKAVVLANPDNQPPSMFIRHHLAVEPGDA
jgi:hypothetical protein